MARTRRPSRGEQLPADLFSIDPTAHLPMSLASRPWPDPAPRSRAGAGTPPAEWMNGRRLSDTGVAAIIASATASLTAAPSATEDPTVQLSPAERRVAELVSQGLTNRETGEQLHIARRTVETHIVHAFQKLGVQNRTQLA